VLQAVSGLVGVSTPVVTALATAAGMISGPALVIPAAVTVVAAVAYGLIVRRRSGNTELQELRRQWISDLDEAAAEYQSAFVAAAHMQGTEMIERAMDILSERVDELSRRVILVENRIAEPAYADRSELVAALEPHVRAGAQILTSFRDLSATAKGAASG
jgi:hypothetical protein